MLEASALHPSILGAYMAANMLLYSYLCSMDALRTVMSFRVSFFMLPARPMQRQACCQA